MAKQDSIEYIETNFEDDVNDEYIPTDQYSIEEIQQKTVTNKNMKQSDGSSVPLKDNVNNVRENCNPPLAMEEFDSPSDSSEKNLLSVTSKEERGHENNNAKSSKSQQSIVSLSRVKIFPENGENGRDVTEDKEVSAIHSFFSREWNAFKKEKTKKLRQIPKRNAFIDFEKLIKEFKNEGDEPERHWTAQAKKREGEKCPELFSTIMIGFCFTLIPNCFIVLDYMAASEYIGGNWYRKYDTDNVTNEKCNKNTNYFECYEYDPVYGGLTLTFTFTSGIFWSAIMFYKLWTYLTEADRQFYDRKRMLVFFFFPLTILSIASFPLQLLIVSIIALFNDQDQWVLLTTRIGIAEGLFNAHFQFLLQLFIFFTRADRHPSTFQYLTLFGSLVMLSYSRVESLLLDRGGHRMSPGQKAWWVVRFAPGFLFNCAFKLGSISLITAMLRFNCIWLYGSVILIWALLQILFNEFVIPYDHYYLFLGAGMHAVTVAHVPEYVKLIDTDPDIKKNVLWSTRLTTKKLKINLVFQNFFWFLFNTIIISTLWIVSTYSSPDTQIPLFWPFTPNDTYTFGDNKVFKVLHIIAPIIIIIGTISQIIILCFEENEVVVKKLQKVLSSEGVQLHHQPESWNEDVQDGIISKYSAPRHYEGWHHEPEDCPGCTRMCTDVTWHKHIYDEDGNPGVQGKFNQVVYPFLNLWENFGDKNTTQT